MPKEILVAEKLPNSALIADSIYAYSKLKISICNAKRGDKLAWLKMAHSSASHALQARDPKNGKFVDQMVGLKKLLGMKKVPAKVECFDVSHTGGFDTVAVCVAFDAKGPLKSDYRKYNVKLNTPGDDYQALKIALQKHLKKVENNELLCPDLLIIDGGKGQLSIAEQELRKTKLTSSLLGMAKGVKRKPGMEKLYLNSKGMQINLPSNDKLFHFLQRVRDEAHRFAITSHRKKREKSALHSILKDIEGVGQKKCDILLKHFGGLQEIKDADIAKLAIVDGIGIALAKRIFKYLH